MTNSQKRKKIKRHIRGYKLQSHPVYQYIKMGVIRHIFSESMVKIFVTKCKCRSFLWRSSFWAFFIINLLKNHVFFSENTFFHVLWHQESENERKKIPSVRSVDEFYLFFYRSNFYSVNGVWYSLIGSDGTLNWKN